MPVFRAMEERHERSARQVARDTRPMGERFAEFLAGSYASPIILSTSIAIILVFSEYSDIIILPNLVLFIFLFTRQYSLPYKLPKISKLKDYNDIMPGTTIPKQAGGIAYWGNEHFTQKELWFSNDDMRTHALIFGSTGSGKTESLSGIAFNSLVQGSGFIYIDGKGDNALYAKIFSMVRRMGRDDDLLLINFMTGARDIIGAQKKRLSNTMNPFSIGSSGMLSQLVVSLMDSSGGGDGGGDMWKGRAIVFVESLLKVLVKMRDEGHILLDANIIRNYFILEKIEEIAVDKQFPLDSGLKISLTNVEAIVLEPIKNYVLNLPGYNPGKKGNQASEVREQHGFITMQLTRAFGSLADTYGHIIRTNLAEVDVKDVVLNRRILVVLLPALEKSPEELANLGKVIIASLKAMMASGLGDEVEGTYRDVVQRKPTNSPTPYVCIMDEYGYYAVKGFAVVPAQARSLGFSAIFAGQDLPAFQKSSKEEAASIGANTNIKICMKLEDPTDTWDFFNKTAGEAYVTNVREFQVNAGSMTNNYLDNRAASVDRRQRIELLDLKDQMPGDAHMFFRSRIVRARMFAPNPKPAKKMQVNQLLCVDRPKDETLINLDKIFKRFAQVFADPSFSMAAAEEDPDVTEVIDALNAQPKTSSSFERSVSAVVSILEKEIKNQETVQEAIEEEKIEEYGDEINAFSSIFLPEIAKPLVTAEEKETFTDPLLVQTRVKQATIQIEKLYGKSTLDATKIAETLIKDIIRVTTYPPEARFETTPEEIVEALEDVINDLQGRSTNKALEDKSKNNSKDADDDESN